ncbi:MAG: hypothetical protein Kow00105_15330 [Phycisphaeraceae bacterium]
MSIIFVADPELSQAAITAQTDAIPLVMSAPELGYLIMPLNESDASRKIKKSQN